MIKVLVTGGIGSGKSSACRLFEELGVPVFYSDTQAAKLMNWDLKLAESIRENFGEHLYVKSQLDRKALAEIVFNDKEKLALLN